MITQATGGIRQGRKAFVQHFLHEQPLQCLHGLMRNSIMMNASRAGAMNMKAASSWFSTGSHGHGNSVSISFSIPIIKMQNGIVDRFTCKWMQNL
ncbi:hypothetical protein AOLI_G00290880 [Acnodon oligacanthus]